MAKNKKNHGLPSMLDMIGGNVSVFSEHDSQLSNLFLTEKEKYDNDKEGLKKAFNYYVNLIKPQFKDKVEYFNNNYEFRYGKINPEDFGLKDDDDDYEEDGPKIKLDNYPIAPNIVNTLIQEGQKRNYNFFPKTVDSQSTNELIEMMTDEMKTNLIEKAKILFFLKVNFPSQEDLNSLSEEEKNKALEEIQKKQEELEQEFQNLPKIQNYYKTKYKPEIVKWAEHLIQRDILKFNMKQLGKQLLEDHITVGDRVLHIRDLGNDYIPEYISPKNYGSISSPNTKCLSESIAFHWTEELEIQHLISKYGNYLSEENINLVKNIQDKTQLGTTFRAHDTYINGINARYDEVNTNNYRLFQNMFNGEYVSSHTSASIQHCYFLLPRKLGKLTIRQKIQEVIDGQEIIKFKDIVEIIDPEVYDSSEKIIGYESKYNGEKILDNLIEGEHIDIFYINEVFYGCKIGTVIQNENLLGETENDKKDIWIKIEKLDYQGSSDYTDYGTQIPCFGGKINSKSGIFISELDKIKPYAVMHNYAMNRAKSLAISWIAPYYGMNNSLFGQSSLEESWQENSIFKAIIAGEETAIVPFDTTNQGTTNQIPQNVIKIDPDRSNMIRTLWDFANLVKLEAYSQIGTSPQFLGQVSPNETATGVTAAQNRSVTQLEHIYEEHFELIKKCHQYMLDLAQVKHFKKGGLIDMSYVTTDAQREIFITHSDNLSLFKKVGLFMADSSKENQTLELMRQLAIQDNTMGADAYEKMIMIDANSKDKLLEKLRILKEEMIERSQKRDENILKQQEMAINAQNEAMLAKQKFDAEQNQLDRESSLLKAQIQALGRSLNNDQNSNNQFDVSEIMKANLENQKLTNSIESERNRLSLDTEEKRQKLILQQSDIAFKQKKSEQEYLLKLKELETRLKISQNQLAQAKENKNKYDVKKNK